MPQHDPFLLTARTDPCAIHFPERHTLEELWLRRLNEAYVRLDSARNCANTLQRLSRDLPSPNTAFVLQQALRAENAALTEYRRVLHVFSNLILNGKIPDENDRPGPNATRGDAE